MSNAGRPPIEIDFSQFEKLCQMMCTLDEIAGFFSCSQDTIERRVKEHYGETFKEAWERFAAQGKISLRREQMKLALAGDRTMLIWLGKQVLGQVDNMEHRLKREEEAVKELTDQELFERAKEVLPTLVEMLPKKDDPGADSR